MSTDSADWVSLNSRFYRRLFLYDSLGWGIDLAGSRVACAPNGGPIAIARDPHALVAYRSADQQQRVRIFNCAGVELSSFPWADAQSAILSFGFTSSERLAILTADGELFIYSLFGERVESFSLPEACKSMGVAEGHFHLDSLVLRLAGSNQLYYCPDVNQPKFQSLPSPSAGLADKPPTAMTVALNSQSGSVEVYLSSSSGSLMLVDSHSATDLQLTSGPFAALAVNPAGDKLAAFSDDGTLFVMPMDFQSNWSKFSTNSKLPPLALQWCGNQCVALHWEKMLLLVSLEGEFVKFSFDSPVHLVAEFDGLRVLTNSTHEFFSPVPESTESIFKLGSTAAAARLFDAFEAYERQQANSNEILRSLQSDESGSEALESAIAAQLDAAANEFHLDIQRQLLRSAAYGKLFAPSFSADEFVETCKVLRVLNQIRSAAIGIPMTMEQYRKLEAEALIDRLIARREHLMAARICEYLNLRSSGQRVLVDWACCKISDSTAKEAALSDEELAAAIIEKLKSSPGVSFAAIAKVAFRAGRRGLACSLLEYEQSAAEQIPLLLTMREDELALDKAINSGDSDLIYLCLLQIQKSRPIKDFYSLISTRPLARSLFQSLARQTDLAGLKKYYYHLAQPVEAANVAVFEAFQCEQWKDRIDSLQIALEFYEKDKSNHPMPAKALEEHLKLLQLQAEFQAELNNPSPPLLDLTLVQLLEYFIVRGDSKRVQKVKNAFKLDEKRMWQIEVRALANGGMWSELMTLVQQYKKVPPIGFVPIIELCIEYGKSSEAVKYIERLPDYREAMEWLCNLGYWKEAAEIAAKNKDVEAIQLIRENCRVPNLVPAIDKLLQIAMTPAK